MLLVVVVTSWFMNERFFLFIWLFSNISNTMLFKWEKFQEKGHSPWSVGWSYEHETWKELKQELDSKEKKGTSIGKRNN